MTDEPESLGPPSHSVVREGRLVAYIWAGDPGDFRQSGGLGRSLCPVSFGQVRSFYRPDQALIGNLIGQSETLPRFLFKLGMEGYEVREGRFSPEHSLRRF